MMPDVDVNLIQKVIDAYNTNINHGHVPFALVSTDNEFWGKQMTDTICEQYANCVSDEISENIEGPNCSLIPCADATHESPYHYLNVSVEPYRCAESTGCVYVNYTTGSGQNQVGLSGTKHSDTGLLEYFVQMSTHTPQTYLTAAGNLCVGATCEILPIAGGFQNVIDYGFEYVDVTCGSDTCGTYSLTVTSKAYKIH